MIVFCGWEFCLAMIDSYLSIAALSCYNSCVSNDFSLFNVSIYRFLSDYCSVSAYICLSFCLISLFA
jgi:hypothetical protein